MHALYCYPNTNRNTNSMLQKMRLNRKYLLLTLVITLFIFVILESMIFIKLSDGYSRYNLNEQAVGASGGSWADGDAGTYD